MLALKKNTVPAVSEASQSRERCRGLSCLVRRSHMMNFFILLGSEGYLFWLLLFFYSRPTAPLLAEMPLKNLGVTTVKKAGSGYSLRISCFLSRGRSRIYFLLPPSPLRLHQPQCEAMPTRTQRKSRELWRHPSFCPPPLPSPLARYASHWHRVRCNTCL